MKRFLIAVICLASLHTQSFAANDWKEEVNKSLSEVQSIWNDAVKIIDNLDGPHYLTGAWSIQQQASQQGYSAEIQLFAKKNALVDEHHCVWNVLYRDMPWYLKLIHKENVLAESSIPDYRAYVISIQCDGMETLYAYNRFNKLFVDFNRFESINFGNYDNRIEHKISDFFDKLMSGQQALKKKVADQYQTCIDAHDLQYYPETDTYAQNLKIKHCGREFRNYCEQYPQSRDCLRRVYIAYDRQDDHVQESDNAATRTPLKQWGNKN
ncbi:MAG: hypothetical protein OQL06_03030 [Gammaproteobacteria bacterium]|nr:hypothetical protein [Gammaproteobacteria bacterium]